MFNLENKFNNYSKGCVADSNNEDCMACYILGVGNIKWMTENLVWRHQDNGLGSAYSLLGRARRGERWRARAAWCSSSGSFTTEWNGMTELTIILQREQIKCDASTSLLRQLTTHVINDRYLSRFHFEISSGLFFVLH